MDTSEFALVAGPRAPGIIRRAVDRVPGLSAEMREDLRLLASALVTAPLLVPSDCGEVLLRLRVTVGPGAARVQIDATCESPPPAPPAGPRRRLPLLERVCTRWGMVRTGELGSVWFELDGRRDHAASALALAAAP
jgi:hypothetical protein